jgi:hypothetical protein
MSISRCISIVYLDRDNTIDLVLLADEVPVDLSAVSRAILELADAVLDSADLGFGPGEVFEVATGTYLGATVDVLRMRLGGETLAVGDYQARLVIYDPDHAGGLVWTDTLPIRVTA